MCLRRDRETFHSHIEPRKDIVEETKRQLDREKITGKLIHVCFTCDPYPVGYDTTPTREIIKAIKESGNHVQILTKSDGTRDFDLLDSEDWYGVTISCNTDKAKLTEPEAINPMSRLSTLGKAKQHGIKTWVSFEPVIDAYEVLKCIDEYQELFDKVKIGKLNYHPSGVDWRAFGHEVERTCQRRGLDYYIKESLRKEMGK